MITNGVNIMFNIYSITAIDNSFICTWSDSWLQQHSQKYKWWWNLKVGDWWGNNRSWVKRPIEASERSEAVIIKNPVVIRGNVVPGKRAISAGEQQVPPCRVLLSEVRRLTRFVPPLPPPPHLLLRTCYLLCPARHEHLQSSPVTTQTCQLTTGVTPVVSFCDLVESRTPLCLHHSTVLYLGEIYVWINIVTM